MLDAPSARGSCGPSTPLDPPRIAGVPHDSSVPRLAGPEVSAREQAAVNRLLDLSTSLPLMPRTHAFGGAPGQAMAAFRAGFFLREEDWPKVAESLATMSLADLRAFKRALLAGHPWAASVARDVALKEPTEGPRKAAQLVKIQRILSGRIFDAVDPKARATQHLAYRALELKNETATAVTPKELQRLGELLEHLRAEVEQVQSLLDPKQRDGLLAQVAEIESSLVSREAPVLLQLEKDRALIRAGTFGVEDLGRVLEQHGDAGVEMMLGVHRGVLPVRDPENLGYRPTTTAAILKLLPHLGPKDLFFDCGAGFGKVALLVAILAKCRVVAIERNPGTAEVLSRSVADFGLGANIEVRACDAKTQDYGDATAVFMFNPFQGSVLEEVAERIRAVAERRRVQLLAHRPADQIYREFGQWRSTGPYELVCFDSAWTPA